MADSDEKEKPQKGAKPTLTPEQEAEAAAKKAARAEAKAKGVKAAKGKKEAAAASATDAFATQDELAELTADWPMQRLVGIWNGLPGVNPISKFTSRKIAIERLWKVLQGADVTPAAQAEVTAPASEPVPVEAKPVPEAPVVFEEQQPEAPAEMSAQPVEQPAAAALVAEVGAHISAFVDNLQATAARGDPGLSAHIAGPAASAADQLKVFKGIDSTLLYATLAVIIDIAVALGMAGSKGEARRLIEQGGVRLNDQPIRTITASVTHADLDANGTARLTVGKKRHGLIRKG